MSAEQTENKGRPELVIPPGWQLEPVQPPPGSMFRPVKLITPEEIEVAEDLPRYKSEIDINHFKNLGNLEWLTLLDRRFTCNCSPTLITGEGESRIESSLILEALIQARERHIMWTSDNKAYVSKRKQSENEEIIKKSLGLNSFISRLLIIAKQEKGTSFLCRPRGEESKSYKGQLDIPGGRLKLTPSAKEHLNSPPIVSTSEALTESFSSGAAREYHEEFGTLVPAIQFRTGSFVTFITNGTDSLFEVTELAVVSPLDLEALKMLGNYRRAQGTTIGNKWQIENIDTVLQEGRPMLPTVFSSLSRFKGQYIYEYGGWQIYGEYIPYNQTYFETRGKEIEI